MFSEQTVNDAVALQEYFVREEIDCVKIVPSHWQALSGEGKMLLPGKMLVFGGDVLPSGVIERIQSCGSSCRIFNHYGPTETTVGKLLHEVKAGERYGARIPLGVPFGNTRVLVLNEGGQVCAAGVPGELYIGGAGVCRGYLNNEGLTAERIVYKTIAGVGSVRLYRTGDRVRYDAQGQLHFIGRMDNQVKVRGYRIELGEIEKVLEGSEMVSQGVVLAHGDGDSNSRLVYYVVPGPGYNEGMLESYLSSRLPSHMLPSEVVLVEALPLTANGKIDRRRLLESNVVGAKHASSGAVRDERDASLVSIWEELLETEGIGIDDNFF